MSLIPVHETDVTLGAPLPWMIYDQDHRVLMEQGSVIDNAADLHALLALGPLRELALPTAAPAEPRTAGNPAPAQVDGATPQRGYSFRDMRLRVGDRLQLEPPAALGSDRHIVKLIGYVEGASLMTSVPMANGMRVQLVEGDMLVMRVFANQNAFAFGSSVLRVCKLPYDYLHLEFPKVIQGAMVRKSPRVRTRIIASVSPLDADTKQPAMIANLSADGALVRARQAMCKSGQRLRLAFRIGLHGIDALITVQAIARSIMVEDEKPGDSPEGGVLHGMQFVELPPNDSMVLQSLIYQTMIEQPQLVV